MEGFTSSIATKILLTEINLTQKTKIQKTIVLGKKIEIEDDVKLTKLKIFEYMTLKDSKSYILLKLEEKSLFWHLT